MIKLKLMLLFVATLIFTFLIILGLSVINFIYKNEIITDKADFFKAVWVVISVTLYSSAIIFILRIKEKQAGIVEKIIEEEKQKAKQLYSEKDFIINRRVTLAYGITMLFLFFAVLVSELLSYFFDEGLLSPVQLAFHTSAFIGYVVTFRYVYKSQDYIEYKSREFIKKQIKEDENL
jgi:Na+/melibiose symporter-like transporter